LTKNRENNQAEEKGSQKGRAPQYASDPFWSPRGESIGYVSTVYNKGEKPLRRIYIAPLSTGMAVKIYEERIDSADQTLVSDRTTPPFFDIDGKIVVITSMVDGLPNLLSIRLSDKKTQVLTHEGALFPAPLPENEEIVYTSLAGGSERVMVMEMDGGDKRPFIRDSKMELKVNPPQGQGR